MTTKASAARRLRLAVLSLGGALCLLAAPIGVTGPLAASASADTAVPVPAAPANLPAGIEDLSPYLPQISCDPTDKPGTLDLARLLTSTYPDTSIIGTSYACGTDGPVSEHYEGRAIDWAIDPDNSQQVAEAHALLSWLFGNDSSGVAAGNARRLGVMYAIYDAQIIGTYDLAAGWRSTPCSGETGCHRDHVHLSLSWAGARAETSWWSGSVAPTDYGPCVSPGFALAATPAAPAPAPNPTPCPAVDGPSAAPAGTPAALVTLRQWSGATLDAGSRGPVVSALQTALGVSSDGLFGMSTSQALQGFQTSHGLPASGVTDAATWTALLGLTTTPTSVIAAAVPAAPVAVKRPVAQKALRKGSHPVLHLGSHGISVMLVQALLHLRITGRYTPSTGNAVRHFQRIHRLTVDGLVGPKTWRALGR